MSYEVKLHPKIDKFLRKCGKELEERIRNRLRLLKEEPFKYLEHYEGEENCYKLRIGDYRALVDVSVEEKKVLVRVLGHRGRIYKKK